MAETTEDQPVASWVWVLCAALPALAYLFSAYPGLSSYRDSGDMAAAAWTLGVAHPPGYPFYVLAGRLWAFLLPLGSVAYRLNVMSAAAGAAACVFAAGVAVRLRRGAGGACATAAAGTAILLGAAPAFWHLSLLSEMYALNALFAAVILWLSAGANSGRRDFWAAALLFGLGTANHQTLLALAPGALLCARGRLSRRSWAVLFSFFALGLAVFLFLPLRSLGDPWLDWGDPETPARLWRVLTRGDYGGVRLHPERPAGLASAAQWASGLAYAVRIFADELSPAGALMSAWGLLAGRRARGAWALALGFFLSGPLFIVWANLDPSRLETRPILEPHLLLPLVCAAALGGLGAADLLGRLRRRSVAAAALAALVLAGGALWVRRADVAALSARRDDFTAWDYGSALAAGLPRGALMLDPDDPTAFTLSYLEAAHGKGTTLTPLLYFRTRWGYERLKARHPELLPEREIKNAQELLEVMVAHNLQAGRPIFVDLPQKTPLGVQSLPEGLGYRLRRGSPDAGERAAALTRAETAFRVLFMRRAPPGSAFFSSHAAAYWSSGLNNAAIEAERVGRPEEAEQFYASALVFDPDLAQAWNNWANAALRRGDTAAAEGRYQASLRLNDDAAVRYNLGRTYLLAGRFDDAQRTYRESLARGGPIEASNDIGLVHMRAGRPEKAVEEFIGLIQRRPGYSLAYYNLGLAYETLGRRREAAQAVRAWGLLSPSPPDRAEAAAWLRRLEK